MSEATTEQRAELTQLLKEYDIVLRTQPKLYDLRHVLHQLRTGKALLVASIPDKCHESAKAESSDPREREDQYSALIGPPRVE